MQTYFLLKALAFRLCWYLATRLKNLRTEGAQLYFWPRLPLFLLHEVLQFILIFGRVGNVYIRIIDNLEEVKLGRGFLSLLVYFGKSSQNIHRRELWFFGHLSISPMYPLISCNYWLLLHWQQRPRNAHGNGIVVVVPWSWLLRKCLEMNEAREKSTSLVHTLVNNYVAFLTRT